MDHESGHRIRSITDQDIELRKARGDASDGLAPEVDPDRGNSSDQRVAGRSGWVGCLLMVGGLLVTLMVGYYLYNLATAPQPLCGEQPCDSKTHFCRYDDANTTPGWTCVQYHQDCAAHPSCECLTAGLVGVQCKEESGSFTVRPVGR